MISTRPLQVTVQRVASASRAPPPEGSAGVGVRPLRLPASAGGRVGTLGYSLGAQDAVLPAPEGGVIQTRLHARALVLADPAGGRVALVFIEAWSATRYLLEAAAARTAALGLGVDRLLLAGTHTHSSPAGVCGNSFYDLLGGKSTGFLAEIADAWVDAIAGAVADADADLRPATLGFGVSAVWGAVSNRSLPAFLKNPEAAAWNSPGSPGAGAPGGLGAAQRAVDPRVTAITVFGPGDSVRAVFAVFAGHATAIGKTQRALSADWPGRAAALASEALGGVVVALAAGASGDLSPLGIGAPASWPRQGEPLVNRTGERFARGVVEAASRAREARVSVTVRARWAEWAPTPSALEHGGGLAPFDLGFVSMGGAEDGPTQILRKLGAPFIEGSGDESHADPRQRPKISARSFVEGMIGRRVPLSPSPLHPTLVLELSGRRFATVPGEPTVTAAARLSAALDATIIGYAGDYAGYFVTAEEYQAQHYEGSSCIYGRNSLAVLTAHLRVLAEAGDEAQPGPVVFDTATALVLAPWSAALPGPADVISCSLDGGAWTIWRSARGEGGADLDHLTVRLLAPGMAPIALDVPVEIRRSRVPAHGESTVFLLVIPAEGLPAGPLRVAVPAAAGWPGWSAEIQGAAGPG